MVKHNIIYLLSVITCTQEPIRNQARIKRHFRRCDFFIRQRIKIPAYGDSEAESLNKAVLEFG